MGSVWFIKRTPNLLQNMHDLGLTANQFIAIGRMMPYDAFNRKANAMAKFEDTIDTIQKLIGKDVSALFTIVEFVEKAE